MKFWFPKNKIITSKGLHILKNKYVFENIQLIIIMAMFLMCITDGFLLMFICTKSIFTGYLIEVIWYNDLTSIFPSTGNTSDLQLLTVANIYQRQIYQK